MKDKIKEIIKREHDYSKEYCHNLKNSIKNTLSQRNFWRIQYVNVARSIKRFATLTTGFLLLWLIISVTIMGSGEHQINIEQEVLSNVYFLIYYAYILVRIIIPFILSTLARDKTPKVDFGSLYFLFLLSLPLFAGGSTFISNPPDLSVITRFFILFMISTVALNFYTGRIEKEFRKPETFENWKPLVKNLRIIKTTGQDYSTAIQVDGNGKEKSVQFFTINRSVEVEISLMYSHIKIIERYPDNYDLHSNWEVDDLDISAWPTDVEAYESEFNMENYRRVYYKKFAHRYIELPDTEDIFKKK